MFNLGIFCNCSLVLIAVAVTSLPQTTFSQQPVVTRTVVKDEPKEENIKIGFDFYASQTNLMPYDGYQNDVITALCERRPS